MLECPNCGELNPERFRLCGFCGTPLVAAPPPEEVRKVVTIVFSDLKGSTDLGERLDSESLREVMSRYFDAMREPLEAHGGTIEKFIGDAVMAVFGLPTLHEDDALRAIRAAAAMQWELASLNDELERRWGVRLTNRTGVNTGEVVAGDPAAGQRLVTGDAVNLAARLEQAAPAGEILIGPMTHRLVRDHVDAEPLPPLTLKGKSEAVPAFRLVAVRETRREPRHAPLVGRRQELEELQRAFAATQAERVARLVTLIAPAGTGKSRLTEEFAARAAVTARVLRCRCKSYGRGITFWPLAELVRAAADIDESTPPEVTHERLAALAGAEAVQRRVAAAIGLTSERFALEELFWGARKLLERLAAERPLVVVCDDVHWAELTFLDLLEHVTEAAEQPILLLATAREDVLELRPDWSEGPHASRLPLRALSSEDTGRVLESLVGGAAIPAAARDRIIEAADGNPLFAEQLLGMLVDEGVLERSDGHWIATADLAELAIPPTIHALLAARLDQLPREERGVLEPASVIGLEFEVSAVRALVAEPARPEIEGRLPHLTRKQLIRPVQAAAEATYRFHHALIRDEAYHRLLKRARADLHERFVAWARERYLADARQDEFEEILGYHLEQAHRYLHELGPLDDRGRALGAEAAERLASAGSSAFARGDMPAAANLLRRAVALLDDDDPARLSLLPSLGEAFAEIGEFALAEVYLEQAIDRPGAPAGDPIAAIAALLRLHVRAQAGVREEDWGDRIVREAEATIPLLEAVGAHVGAATAWRAVAWAHGTAGRFGETADAAERAVEHATAAGDDRQRRRASSQYAQAALYGPTPAPEAIVRCEQILAQATGDHRTLGLVRGVLSRLVAMRGDVELARGLYRGAQRALGEGGRNVVASTSLFSCGVEMLAGDPAAAERELRRDFDALTAMGEKYLRSTIAGELVRALLAQDKHEEASRYSAVAEELAADDDVTSQALWRAGRARLLARTGEHERAVALAREAVALVEDTDALIDRAEMLSDQADVLARAGESAAAARAAAAALALHERKGNLVAAEALRLAPATASGRCGSGPGPP